MASTLTARVASSARSPGEPPGLSRTQRPVPATPPPEARELIGQFLTEEQQNVWLDLLDIHSAIVAEQDARLLEEHRLPLSHFEVLIRITHAVEAEISISELAAQVPLSPSQVSRIVMDLERRGFVARHRNERDARSTCVAITPEGSAAMAAAAPTYLDVLRRRLFDKLTEQDVKNLGRAWSRARS